MKTLEEIKVSVYPNVYSKKPQTMSFLEVMNQCIRPVYAQKINLIRRYFAEGDREAAQQLKSKLNCFTPAGTFDGAHAIRNFVGPSHIICLDYDHVPDRLQIIHVCASDPHTVAAIESPTDGIKVFAYVEGIEGRHREGQRYVSRYYDELLHLESDPACKDESRLCYFSYSPNGYLAALYQPFVLDASPSLPQDCLLPGDGEERLPEYVVAKNVPRCEIGPQKGSAKNKWADNLSVDSASTEKMSVDSASTENVSVDSASAENGAVGTPSAENLPADSASAENLSAATPSTENLSAATPSAEELEKFISSYIFLYPLTVGHRHNHLFKLACEAARRKYPGEAVVRQLTAILQHTDFPMSELKSVIFAGYQQVAKNPSPLTAAYTAAFKKDKRTEETPILSDSEEELEDAYWQGEEYRKRTPYLPDDLFKNLPDLLNDCILEEGSKRERDVSFLADLVAISAVLPQTFGIYNHKKYSTHLYSVIIAPAGSGKSVAQTGRYLLEEVHSTILAASQHTMKVYEREHAQWLADRTRSKKKGQECPEEPERPPFKTLIIPATTSYTRMQIQMQDNGAQGSIIFETEAQTLSVANHLDCGNFEDMLCKASEHECIGSSYKINGICPISISHPKLALLLTGTPGQLDNLLSSSENGMTSRILHYTFRTSPHWKEMGDESVSTEDAFQPLAHRVAELYGFCQEHPTLFHFSRTQWNCLNSTFSHLLTEVVMEGNDDLQAVVKRYACMVMRISMIITRIRQFESNDTSAEIYCSDADFDRSLRLVLCCYEHSRLLLSSMKAPRLRPLKDPDHIRHFIHDLPDRFTTEEAIRVGETYRFNTRKISRLLKSLNGVKISKIAHGLYTKLPDR